MSAVTVQKEASPGKPLFATFPGFGPSLFSPAFSMSPFAMMRQMTEEMDRFLGIGKTAPNGEEVWSPAVELKRTNGNIVVSAELPRLLP